MYKLVLFHFKLVLKNADTGVMNILDLGNPTTVAMLIKALMLNRVLEPETETKLKNMPYFRKLHEDNSFYTNRWLSMKYSDVLTLKHDFGKQQEGN